MNPTIDILVPHEVLLWLPTRLDYSPLSYDQRPSVTEFADLADLFPNVSVAPGRKGRKTRSFGKWLGRILLVVALGLAGFVTFAPLILERLKNPITRHDPWPVGPEAQTLHDSLLIGDLHADSLLWKRDLLKRASRGQVDLPRLIEGNVALQVFTAMTKSPTGLNYDANSGESFDSITALAIGQLWPLRTWDSLLERTIYQAE